MIYMNDLEQAIARAQISRDHLVFVGDDWKVGKYSMLCLNHVLPSVLVVLSRGDRAKYVSRLLSELIESTAGEIILLNGIEVLFDRSLAVDPIRLLATCAKNKTLLVSWPGDKTSSGLSYATPSHPEHRTYKTSDLSDAIFLTADAQLS